MVVEGDPFPDGPLRSRSCLPGMQADGRAFQGAPQPLDEDVVEMKKDRRASGAAKAHRTAGAARRCRRAVLGVLFGRCA